MTLAPPRQRASAGRPLIESLPLRNPESDDQPFMGRRAWWLVAMNFLVPGSAQILAGNRRLGRFGLGATLLGWVLVLLAAGLALFWRSAMITLAGNWFVLTLVQVLLIAYAVLWVVLTIDTIRLLRVVKLPTVSRFLAPIAALLVLSLAVWGTLYASTAVASTRGAFTSIFGSSGPSLPPSDGYYNILLLGADSGTGRDSLRYDSISVVSVNAATGKVTIFGIPRDMPKVPFAEDSPMRDPKLVGYDYRNFFEGHDDATCGWGSGINQLTNAVQVCRKDKGQSLYPEAVAHGSDPGIEATKDAAEGVLGIEIPYYVFVDMNGFADLIDALGGVDIKVEKRLPKGGGPGKTNKPVSEWATGWIEPGQQHMNGDTAQWYARSRYTTSDFDRMKRQRQLQQAILAQFTPQNVLTHFSAVADAGAELAHTDLPQDKLPEFFDLIMKAKKQKVTTIELTPDGGVSERHPDFGQIHEMVQQALHPPTKTPTP
ncbi:LCP family protein [Microbacterium sp. NPDC057659]|uniref:LCP family protein n=1 Tax=Microbacterium sp. NPDC057659 TaxID=3346198 RepID=UPI00367175EA